MTTTHWTERSSEDFLYSIASDFVEQLRTKMKRLGMSQSKLAKAAKVSKGYVSQVFNDPGNLTLITIVKFAKAVDMKVSVVSYEDASPEGAGRGPVNAEVFRICWERQGRPTDMWSLKSTVAVTSDMIYAKTAQNLLWGYEVYLAKAQPVGPRPKGAGTDIQLTAYDASGITSARKQLNSQPLILGE
jgi:transcriptional regulator with XRE-family HTH domain